MNLDQVCLALVVLAAVAGAFQGARRHALRLGALAAGWAGARLLAPAVAEALHGRVPPFAAAPLASVAAFAGCALAARVALGALLALFVGQPGEKGGVDRGLGALLGAAQAAVLVWVLVSALAAWGKPLRLGVVTLDPAHSELAALARGPAGATRRSPQAVR